MELNDDWLSWPPEAIEQFFTAETDILPCRESFQESDHEDA